MTKINDIITNEDGAIYVETAAWCNENNAFLEEIEPEDEVRRFQVKAIPEPTLEEHNEQIRFQRQYRYTQESDPIKLDYDEALARGDSGKAEQLRQQWLSKKDQIRDELPYE